MGTPVFLDLTPVVMHQRMNSGAAKNMRSTAGSMKSAPLKLWKLWMRVVIRGLVIAAAAAAAGKPLVIETCESEVACDMRIRSHVATIHRGVGSNGMLMSAPVVLS